MSKHTKEAATETDSSKAGRPAEHAASEQHARRKRVLLVVAGVLAGIYVAGAVFFSFYFFPNTTIDGHDASLMSAAELHDHKTKQLDDFTAEVTGDGLNFTLAGADVDLALDADAYVRDAQAQQLVWAWPAELARTHELSVRVRATYDAEKLKALLASKMAPINEDATLPTDATIAYDQASKSFKIKEEVYGTELDAELLEQTVGTGLAQLKHTIKLGKESLVQPAVTSSDARLKKACTSANECVEPTVELKLAGAVAFTVDASVTQAWVVVGDDLSVSLSEDAERAWVAGELANTLNTVGTERTYTRGDGATCTVKGGTYGWQIDADALAPLLFEALHNGTASIDVPVEQSAASWTGAGQADWGDTYIDADLTQQYVRFYKAGELVWESACVSGNTSNRHGTPTGVYSINKNKTTNTTLIGLDENGDGEPDYRTDVKYWIPFVGNMVAFHDASWRYTFGGSVYRGNGSHGCINLPSAAAAQLYDIADIGTPVVVHY